MRLTTHLPIRPDRKYLVAFVSVCAAARLLALEVTTNQVFQANSGGRLVMDLDRGSIEILTADTNAVRITVIREVKGVGDQKAREILESHHLAFSSEGNTVTVQAKMPKTLSLNWSGPQLSARYRVTVPKQFDLNLDTAGGSIQVADISGKLMLHTAGGSIGVGKLEGTVKAETAGGSIKVASATGTVDVDTAGGSIQLGKMGAAVNADTSGGSIRIESAAGPVHADTSGGSIELGEMQGPVKADTSGGSISARFAKAPAGDSSLDTSGGSITVYVAETAGFDLDAECSGGRVHSELSVDSNQKPSKTELRGKIGSGGPKLVLRTSGGGIAVKRWVAANP